MRKKYVQASAKAAPLLRTYSSQVETPVIVAQLSDWPAIFAVLQTPLAQSPLFHLVSKQRPLQSSRHSPERRVEDGAVVTEISRRVARRRGPVGLEVRGAPRVWVGRAVGNIIRDGITAEEIHANAIIVPEH